MTNRQYTEQEDQQIIEKFEAARRSKYGITGTLADRQREYEEAKQRQRARAEAREREQERTEQAKQAQRVRNILRRELEGRQVTHKLGPTEPARQFNGWVRGEAGKNRWTTSADEFGEEDK